MSGIYPPYQKPPGWNIDPDSIAHNYARMGLPVSVLEMPFWFAGNKVFDYSKNRNTGTLYGNAAWVKNAIYFPGNTDYVRVEDSPSIKNFSALTLEALVYPTADASADWGRIISKAQGTGTDDYALTRADPSYGGKIVFRINTNLGTTTLVGGTTLGNNLKWYHAVSTWDGDAMKIYLDGKLDNSGNQGGTLDNSNDYLGIGRHVASSTRNFTGYIAYVRIFPVALTLSQVQILKNNPYGMFESVKQPSIWSVPSGPTYTLTADSGSFSLAGQIRTKGANFVATFNRILFTTLHNC